MKDIAERLGGKNAVIGVLVLALLAQMPHAQYVFFSNSHNATWFSWFQSWGAAIALEVAVLLFVIRSNTRVSWGFAVFSILINLMYYYDIPYIAPFFLAAGLPVAIALYSHEVASHKEQPNTNESEQRAQQMAIELQKVQTKLERVSTKLEAVSTENEQLRQQAVKVGTELPLDELSESVREKLLELNRIVLEHRITQPGDLLEHGMSKTDAYKIWPVAIAGRAIYKNGDGAYHTRQ